MRTRALKPEELRRLKKHLVPRDALAVQIAHDTGLRVSDVLRIKSKDVKPKMAVTEKKTNKTRTVRLRKRTVSDAREYALHGGVYLIDCNRSTIYRNIKKACKLLQFQNVSMHSVRKTYAQGFCKRHGIKATQEELQHENIYTTMGYVYDISQLEKGTDT